MPSFLRNEVVLVSYPFTDFSAMKIRPAIVIHAPHSSVDLVLVPLSSQIAGLTDGEFVLNDWAAAGLKMPSAIKRRIATIHPSLVIRKIGSLTPVDAVHLDASLRFWLGL